MFDIYTHQIKYTVAISPHYKRRNKIWTKKRFTFLWKFERLLEKCKGTRYLFRDGYQSCTFKYKGCYSYLFEVQSPRSSKQVNCRCVWRIGYTQASHLNRINTLQDPPPSLKYKGTGSPPENSIEVEPCVKENNPIIIPIPRFSREKNYSLRKQLITCDSRQPMYEK